MGLVQKAFSDIITFSRSSNATRVGPTGLVEYAPHNLLLQSQTFDNASWTAGNATVTANAASAPDGTVTADVLTENSLFAAHRVFQSVTTTAIPYTASCYLKAGSRNWGYIRIRDSGSTDRLAFFNLATGVLGATGTGLASTIQSVGNGWYRCTATLSSPLAGSNPIVIGLSSADGTEDYTGNGTGNIYLWGAQLSVGPYALDYTPTTSAAVYGPRFDYDGSGVTIVEPVSRNLLTYSEQFDNAAWGKDNVSVTANATTAPDGTVTADKLVDTATNAIHNIYQVLSSTSGINYTASLYVKKAERPFAYIRIGGISTSPYAVFNMDTGTLSASGNLVSSSITSVGNGWYRITVTVTADSSVLAVNYGAAPAGYTLNASNIPVYTGDGTSGVFIWGAQLEVGSTATGYMPSGATNGFRAVPVVSGSATARGLLVEEQRTNLLTYSDDFSNATWNKGSGFTLTQNAIVSPDGTVNADLFVRGTTGIYAYLAQSNSGNASQALTFSCWVRTVSGTSSIRLVISDVNLASLNSSALSINTTWQRLSFSITAGQLSNTGLIGVGFLMDAGQSAYFWGAQLEVGSFATSYIPTLASTVTRSADVASVNTLSPWFNATEGTLFAEIAPVYVGSGSSAATAQIRTDSSNVIGTGQNTGWGDATRFDAIVIAGGAEQAYGSSTSALTAGTGYKTAVAYKANDIQAALNGSSFLTDTSATIPAITALTIGGNYLGNVGGNGWFRRVAYYPRRLTSSELLALTA